MNLDDALKGRRSIRRFEKKAVPKKILDEIVDAVKYVPTAHNLQDYEIYVLTDEKKIADVAHHCLDQEHVKEAPVLFIVCGDVEKDKTARAPMFACQGASMAAYVIELKAYELGLGSCWVGLFHEGPIRDILGVPFRICPMAVIPVGYAAEKPKMPKRHTDYVHFVE